MKFQPKPAQAHTITAYGPGWIALGPQRITQSIIMQAGQPWQPWGVASFDALDAAAFARLAEPSPELVVFGSGERLRFPRPAWIRPLVEKRIGIETMDTPAACRTFNILADEGRRVLLALLVEPIR